METNYKLKSNIIEFIISEAGKHPELGCRKIASLVQTHFKMMISKSSISAILKAKGLNKPIGRRRIRNSITIPQSQEYKPQNNEMLLLITEQAHHLISHKVTAISDSLEKSSDVSKLPSVIALGVTEDGEHALSNVGCWFLKAADACLGGIQEISSAIREFGSDFSTLDLDNMSENMLYSPSEDATSKYSEALSKMESLAPKLLGRLNASCQEILYLKFVFEDDSYFLMDAACHSIWPTPRIPDYFSVALQKIKGCINNSLILNAQPLILQSPPGFKMPPLAFLKFLACFKEENIHNPLKCIELYNTHNELSQTYQPAPQHKYDFILGLWPWQYVDHQQLAPPSPMIFTETQAGQRIMVRQVAFQREGREIITLLTNIEEQLAGDEKIRMLYARRWPNFEIGYQDFLNKIEISYDAHRGKPKIPNEGRFSSEMGAGFPGIFEYWRKVLHGYCQRHFFPFGYCDVDFATCKKYFYELKGWVKTEEQYCKVIFEPPKGYGYSADLLYGCQRINEAGIYLPDGKQILFGVM